MIFAYQT